MFIGVFGNHDSLYVMMISVFRCVILTYKYLGISKVILFLIFNLIPQFYRLCTLWFNILAFIQTYFMAQLVIFFIWKQWMCILKLVGAVFYKCQFGQVIHSISLMIIFSLSLISITEKQLIHFWKQMSILFLFSKVLSVFLHEFFGSIISCIYL